MAGLLEDLARLAVPSHWDRVEETCCLCPETGQPGLCEWACMVLPTHHCIYEAAITEVGETNRGCKNTLSLSSETSGN